MIFDTFRDKLDDLSVTNVDLVFTEYGQKFRYVGDTEVPTAKYARSLDNGLWTASILIQCIRQRIAAAARWGFVNDGGYPSFCLFSRNVDTNAQAESYWAHPAGLAYQQFARLDGCNIVYCRVCDSPTNWWGATGYDEIEAVAALSTNGYQLRLLVLNKSFEDIPARLHFNCFEPYRTAARCILTSSNVTDRNLSNYRPVTIQEDLIKGMSNNYSHTFPRISISVIEMQADNDRDDLPDEWEFQFSASLTNLSFSSDRDGDRLCDGHEFLAGTDPTNTASCLRLLEPELEPGTGVVVRWHSVSDRWYRLDRSSNLLCGFTHVVMTNIPAVPPTNTVSDSVSDIDKCLFYRIGLETPR